MKMIALLKAQLDQLRNERLSIPRLSLFITALQDNADEKPIIWTGVEEASGFTSTDKISWKVDRAGLYSVTTRVALGTESLGSADIAPVFYVKRNGALVPNLSSFSTTLFSTQATGTIRLQAGDTLQVSTNKTGGGHHILHPDPRGTSLLITKIG